MNKETWPDNYIEPAWLQKLQDEVPFSAPSQWLGRWQGLLFASVAIALTSEIGMSPLKWFPQVFGVLSGLALMFVSNSVLYLNSESLLALFLQQKAKADSYSRAWRAEEIEAMRQDLVWSKNAADNRHALNKKPSQQPVSYSNKVIYLDILIQEIERRMTERNGC